MPALSSISPAMAVMPLRTPVSPCPPACVLAFSLSALTAASSIFSASSTSCCAASSSAMICCAWNNAVPKTADACVGIFAQIHRVHFGDQCLQGAGVCLRSRAQSRFTQCLRRFIDLCLRRGIGQDFLRRRLPSPAVLPPSMPHNHRCWPGSVLPVRSHARSRSYLT